MIGPAHRGSGKALGPAGKLPSTVVSVEPTPLGGGRPSLRASTPLGKMEPPLGSFLAKAHQEERQRPSK